MKCPSCQSGDVVRDGGFTICYNCGCRELTANFLEIGDKELTYKETQAVKIVDTYDMINPLLNSDSPHYKILNDESIEIFEKIFTKEELIAWSKITYYKYMFRLGKKDDVDKELKKMKTYKEYFEYLSNTNV